MGITKTKTNDQGKVTTSKFVTVGSKQDSTKNDKQKKNAVSKGVNNLFTGMDQSGLIEITKEGKIKVDKKKDTASVTSSMVNMFLKVPGVKRKDLKGLKRKVLKQIIKNSPEVKRATAAAEAKASAAAAKASAAGGSAASVTASSGSASAVGNVPGWISVTRLIGEKRAA